MSFKEVFKGIGLSISETGHVFPFPSHVAVETLDESAHNPMYLSKYLPPGRYDFVYSGRRLNAMNLPKAAILEWWHAVKVGGHLVLLLPNEDKFGVRQSKAAGRNAWTFTIWKSKSWSARSINVVEIVALLYDAELICVETLGKDILVIVRKVPKEQKVDRLFRHSGARGDIIYGLAAMKALGGGTLALNVQSGKHFLSAPMDNSEMADWAKLLEGESYIKSVVPYAGEHDVDLDEFRDMDVGNNYLFQCHLTRFAVNYDLTQPWLSKERIGKDEVASIVIARSPRYHGPFSWHVLKGFEECCVFIGSPNEHADFVKTTGLNIAYHPTKSVAEVGRVIAGSKLFVGNQSFPYSLAEAMKVPRVLEVCLYAPNCNPQGENGYIHLTPSVIEKYVYGKDVCADQVTRMHFDMAGIRESVSKKQIPLHKARPVLGRPLVSFIFMDGKLSDTVENHWLGVVSNEKVVLSGEASFFEMANAGAEAANGDVLCVMTEAAAPSAHKLFQLFSSMDVGMASEFMAVCKTPFVFGGVLLVSRQAYEEWGMFSNSVSDGAKWLEMFLRYTRGGWRCLFGSNSDKFVLNPTDADKRLLKAVYGVELP